ncbi:hypothetical protein Aduo_015401 [Ancylostoma duodenale]
MISKKTWSDIGKPATEPYTLPVKTADGSPMEIIGRFKTDFTVFDRHHRPTKGRGLCYVTQSTDLLGLEWCIQMPDNRQFNDQYHCRMATTALDRIRNETVTSLKARFADMFSPGLGRCTKTKAKLVLKPDATPIYRQRRPVPFASQSAVNAEIDRLLNEGVLSAVDHSNWAAPMVVVKKSNGTSLTRLTESDGNDPSTATSTSRPLRRSTRQRRAPTPLNMDPSRKTYLGV